MAEKPSRDKISSASISATQASIFKSVAAIGRIKKIKSTVVPLQPDVAV